MREAWPARTAGWTSEDQDGGGVVLPGPCGDKGSQGGIGGEDAVVAVAVNAGRREEVGDAVEELGGGESEGGAGLWDRVWAGQRGSGRTGPALALEAADPGSSSVPEQIG